MCYSATLPTVIKSENLNSGLLNLTRVSNRWLRMLTSYGKLNETSLQDDFTAIAKLGNFQRAVLFNLYNKRYAEYDAELRALGTHWKVQTHNTKGKKVLVAKFSYNTYEEAVEAYTRYMMAHPEDPRPMSAYKCDYCGKWHIGHERLPQQVMELAAENFQEKDEKISASCLPSNRTGYIDSQNSNKQYKNMYGNYYDEYEDEYAGTYAHDVEGYSDDDIDTIFDGDPNAYWNID